VGSQKTLREESVSAGSRKSRYKNIKFLMEQTNLILADVQWLVRMLPGNRTVCS
jgi:hypothetical protein